MKTKCEDPENTVVANNVELTKLKKQLREEQSVGMRPAAFMEEFLRLSREEQDFCIKYIEELPLILKSIQKQQDREIGD